MGLPEQSNGVKIAFQLSQKDLYRSNVATAMDSVRESRIIRGFALVEALVVAGFVGYAFAPTAVCFRMQLILAGVSIALFLPVVILFTLHSTYILPLSLRIGTIQTCTAKCSGPSRKT
jgi:ABC-type glycerol-3-phosphate transport system permease component